MCEKWADSETDQSVNDSKRTSQSRGGIENIRYRDAGYCRVKMTRNASE